jgi:hypothetical protein
LCASDGLHLGGGGHLVAATNEKGARKDAKTQRKGKGARKDAETQRKRKEKAKKRQRKAKPLW